MRFVIQKKFALLILVCILLLIPIVILLIFLHGQNKVLIVNESKNYTVTLNSKDRFNGLLRSWGFWNSNAVTINKSPQAYTIKSLKIILTDEKQSMYSLPGPKGIGDTVVSSGLSFESGVLIDKIYIKPGILDNSETQKMFPARDLSGVFTWAVYMSLLNSTHSKDTIGKNTRLASILSKQERDRGFTFKVKER